MRSISLVVSLSPRNAIDPPPIKEDGERVVQLLADAFEF